MPDHPLMAWIFGKLPVHGDFVSRGLKLDDQTRLDHWLSDEMARARIAHGETFEARYDIAPPWRFVAGGEGGVICASIDAAGRRFPLLAGMQLADALLARPAAQAAEEAVYRAFDAGLNVDALWELMGEACLEPDDILPRDGWWVDGGEDFIGERWPQGLISRMLAVEAA